MEKKEYRVFVIEGKIVSISRFTDYVFHKIEPSIYEKALKITSNLKGFPSSYVIDFFEYEKNGNKKFDVLGFTPSPASGTYLYNSIIDFCSNNILHENIYQISLEKRSKLEEKKH